MGLLLHHKGDVLEANLRPRLPPSLHVNGEVLPTEGYSALGPGVELLQRAGQRYLVADAPLPGPCPHAPAPRLKAHTPRAHEHEGGASHASPPLGEEVCKAPWTAASAEKLAEEVFRVAIELIASRHAAGPPLEAGFPKSVVRFPLGGVALRQRGWGKERMIPGQWR